MKRIADNYAVDNSKDDLWAEILARRADREGQEGKNMFPGLTGKTGKDDMILALEADDKNNGDVEGAGVTATPPAGATFHGGTAEHESAHPPPPANPNPEHAPHVAPGPQGFATSAEQKDAAGKEKAATDQRSGHVAQTKREQATAHRLPVHRD